jgi:glycogen debranching enzyme
VWADRYYSTVDATPLFLVLLSELWRWSGDDAIVRELEGHARRALAWIDAADRDGEGFVEYLRRATHGLDNQNWKDSHNSMVFRDGSWARAPIAAVEVQGYVYDAKLRVAEPELGWYALGLDAEKRPIDALASNMGHLLWSGLLPPERVDAVAERLVAPALWSGWGVRTLAADEAAFDPLEYHNGTVWPHDNSLIAFGLARGGRRREAERVVRALLDAAPFFDHRLPELFAGFERGGDAPPGVVPTSARPQAWAAGTPVLLLRALLGLEPDSAAGVLRVTTDELPAWADGLALMGVHALGRRWNVRVDGGAADVTPE